MVKLRPNSCFCSSVNTFEIDRLSSLGLEHWVSGDKGAAPPLSKGLSITTLDQDSACQFSDLHMRRGEPQGLLKPYLVGQFGLLWLAESLFVLVCN